MGLLCAAAFSVLAWGSMRFMGPIGLVVVSAGLFSACVLLILLVRKPIVICAVWFLAMSGLQAVGMIRMPGLPDFSIARLFLVLVLIMIPIGVIRGRHLFTPPYAPDILVIAHAVYVLLNMYLLGDGLRFNTWVASSLAPAVGYFFGKQFVKEEGQLRVLLVFLSLVSVYFWVTCIGEHFEIRALVWPKEILNRDIGNSWFGRSRGPFLQPSLTGQFLGWYLMIQLFLLTRRINITVKVLVVLNIAMIGVALLYTYTRGPWLATAVGLGVMAVLRPGYRKMILAASVVGVLMTVTDFLRPSQDEFLEERLGTTDTIENRLGFLATATRMIAEKPLFGVGYFQYLDEAPLYNRGTSIPFYGFVKRQAGADVAIHDIYIGRAAEEGLVSLMIFLGLVGVCAYHMRRQWRVAVAGTWYGRDFIALTAGIAVSYLLHGMIIDFRYFDIINVLPLFLVGIVMSFPSPTDLAEAGGSPGDRLLAGMQPGATRRAE